MAASLRKFLLLSRRTRSAVDIFKGNCQYKTRALSTSCNRRSTEGETTHFGFEDVTKEEKSKRVHEVFSNVAEKYDVMNDAMSLGIHRIWKDIFIQRLNAPPGTHVLDVAGGTGDIAFRFLEFVKNKEAQTINFEVPQHLLRQQDWPKDGDEDFDVVDADVEEESHVTVCDINRNMLDVGKKRAAERGIVSGISWLEGNAEDLPVESDSMDAYTIAFGIRNVTEVQKALDEAYRVLKPGGRFLCLEFSDVQNPLVKSVYDTYSFHLIPVLGQIIAGDWHSYQYLVESIRKFPDQEEFAYMIEEAGFSNVTVENLSFGIAAIHSGFKL